MGEAVSIEHLRVGDRARIVCLDTSNRRHLHKLISFGLLPGAQAVLLQTYPAYVLAVEHTQIALDPEIAGTILFAVVK
jgi:ferrous iron transport protein A